MPEPPALSDDALELLRLHLGGRSLLMGGPEPESLPGRTVAETRTEPAGMAPCVAFVVLSWMSRAVEPAKPGSVSATDAAWIEP